METFLLVLAALFPIVNPPGTALIFLSLTRKASPQTRRWLARQVAINAFFIMAASFTVGALILKFFGISIPVLRVSGGFIVAVTGWRLLDEGSPKTAGDIETKGRADFAKQAFYPLTLPLTTGPGTITVMISIGLSHTVNFNTFEFFIATFAAAIVIAVAIYICFAYSDHVERVFGTASTDVLVRLTAFILFCLGVQIAWAGVSELVGTLQKT